jgi:hypothetical protein
MIGELMFRPSEADNVALRWGTFLVPPAMFEKAATVSLIVVGSLAAIQFNSQGGVSSLAKSRAVELATRVADGLASYVQLDLAGWRTRRKTP